MNIVWVEDFGGGLQFTQGVIEAYFSQLLPQGAFDEWDESSLLECTDFSEYQIYLEKFIQKHSNNKHQVKLFITLTEAYAYISSSENIKSDIFVVDSNLTRNVNFNVPLNIPIDNGIPGTTLTPKEREDLCRVGGSRLVQRIHEAGIPLQNICILTAHEAEAKDCLLEKLKSLSKFVPVFSKNPKDRFANYLKWLKEHIENQYMVLRRAFFDAVEESLFLMKSLINKQKASNVDCTNQKLIIAGAMSIFPGMTAGNRYSNPPSHEQINIHLNNLLHEVPNSFPIGFPGKEINLSKGFRELVFYWEKDLDTRDFSKNPFLGSVAWVLKNARNWSQHRDDIQFIAKDFSYVFMLYFRILFNLSPLLQAHEQILLDIFEQSARIDQDVVLKAAQKQAVAIYQRFTKYTSSTPPENSRDSIQRGNCKDFKSYINYLSYKKVPINDDPRFYNRGLYQILWYELLFSSSSDFSTFSWKNKGLVDFTDTTNFLPLLFKAIYKESFP